jgi:hypothetical protein
LLGKHFGGNACIVPGKPLVVDDHALLVAFARQQHRVARSGTLEQQANGGAAVKLNREVFKA